MKMFLFRFMNGFCYSIAITMMVHAVVILITGHVPMMTEYRERFDSELLAFVVELLLIGVMSAFTSAGTMILEWKRMGLVVQSILYFLVMLAAWIPVGCFLWGVHKYPSSAVSTILSMIVTYGICWGIQYKLCARDVKEINGKLQSLQE